MTYLTRNPVVTSFITFTADGTQTAAGDGDKVKFPTKVTSGSDNVSISSAGVLSLDSSRSYYIQAHLSCDRPSNSSDVALEFYNDSTNAKLGQSDGAFEARYLPTSSGTLQNGSTIGQLSLENPTFDISIRLNRLGAGNNADIKSACHLFIIEMQY